MFYVLVSGLLFCNMFLPSFSLLALPFFLSLSLSFFNFFFFFFFLFFVFLPVYVFAATFKAIVYQREWDGMGWDGYERINRKEKIIYFDWDRKRK